MQKKLLLMLPVLLIAGVAVAQKDTTEISVKVISGKDGDSVIVDAAGQQWGKFQTRKNVTTYWLSGIDLGFSNFVDNTDYGSAGTQEVAPGVNADWFDLRNGKSVNVNLWLFSQKINLIKHHVNLKYALGLELNNYRFRNPIRFNENAPYVRMDATEGRNYRKNKLAADYVTFPIMLNFNFGKSTGAKALRYSAKKTKNGNFQVSAGGESEWGFSLGVSAGYLYSSRNKTITSDEGKEKLKDNFNLQPWKLAYVGEVNLGYISLYGSYAVKTMFKNGLDLTPYNLGLRLGL